MKGSVFFALLFLTSSVALAAVQYPPLKDVPKQSKQPDPGISKQWQIKNIRADQAWRVTMGDPRVTIAFIDSGIVYNHPDLARNLKRKASEWPFDGRDSDNNHFPDDVIGWDFVQNHTLPYDRSNGHGTYVASLAAAVFMNGFDGSGICPQCSILPVRVLNSNGTSDDETVLAGFRYAIDEGVKVINYSAIGEGFDKDWYRMMRYALEKDVVVVVAAGNDRENNDRESNYPANFDLPNMLSVAATNKDNDLWKDDDGERGSNWGVNKVAIAAPGDDVCGSWSDKTMWCGSGTSFSTPIAAGAVGLLRSAAPWLTASQVVQIMIRTSKKVPALEKKIRSGGVIDLVEAMKMASRFRPL